MQHIWPDLRILPKSCEDDGVIFLELGVTYDTQATARTCVSKRAHRERERVRERERETNLDKTHLCFNINISRATHMSRAEF